MDETTEDLRQALADTAATVDAVRADQWSLPTPCSRWTVREVARHLVAGHHAFARALQQQPPSGDGTEMVDDDRWPATYRESAAAMLAAFAAPGVLDRPVTVPFGTVPGSVALHLRVVEALVHGWDLAQATGQPTPQDHERDERAERELAWAEPWLARVPPDRSPFATPVDVPGDAPALDRLVARLGRDVAWTAPGGSRP